MTLDELNKLFRDTVRQNVSISEVIKYYPNAPAPKGDYATVNILNLKKISLMDFEYRTNLQDLDEVHAMVYSAMVSVNFFKGNARQLAAELAGVFEKTSVIEIFNASAVGFTSSSEVRDLTIEFDSRQQERSQIDISIEFELTKVQELVTGIDSLQINGKIDNGAEIIDTLTINIP